MAGVSVLVSLAVAVLVSTATREERTEVHTDGPVETRTSTRLRVVDGDTLRIDSEYVRLHGIDAPEKRQPCSKGGTEFPCGIAATEYLASLVENKEVTCSARDIDRFGRTVGVCTVDGKDLGRLMVRHGWALAYRKYASDYINDEATARDRGLGMWATEFVSPWEWRGSKRGESQ